MISFGATPLYSITLKQNGKPTPAKISRLNIWDKEDRKAIREIKKDLKGQNTKYGLDVAKNFLDCDPRPYGYYVVELNSDDEFKDRIACLMETINKSRANGDGYTHVRLLGTRDKVAKEQNIQGLGRAMIYGAIKMAQEDDNGSVVVDSRNDDFYKYLSFEAEDDEDSPFSNTFSLPSAKYDEFISETEKKYKYY